MAATHRIDIELDQFFDTRPELEGFLAHERHNKLRDFFCPCFLGPSTDSDKEDKKIRKELIRIFESGGDYVAYFGKTDIQQLVRVRYL
jgi:hypothetical protein